MNEFLNRLISRRWNEEVINVIPIPAVRAKDSFVPYEPGIQRAEAIVAMFTDYGNYQVRSLSLAPSSSAPAPV